MREYVNENGIVTAGRGSVKAKSDRELHTHSIVGRSHKQASTGYPCVCLVDKLVREKSVQRQIYLLWFRSRHRSMHRRDT